MEQKLKKASSDAASKTHQGFTLIKRNGKTDNSKNPTPSAKPTNVEGHYPRFMLPGAVNLLEEDLRELSIILESFLPQLEKIGIHLTETNNLIREIVTSTEAFTRLKGISQIELLPFAFKQVPWFTRYTHSCLTYVFAEHVIDKLNNKLNLHGAELEASKLCFLIHDLGHGPFSHLTERAFKKPKGKGGKIPKEYDHEVWTKVLLNELQEQLFDAFSNPYLPGKDIYPAERKLKKSKEYNLEIFSKALLMISKNYNPIISTLLSSQIDIDRLSNYLGDRIVVNAILEEEDVKNERMVKLLSSISEAVDNIKRIMNNLIILEIDEMDNKCEPYLAITEDAVNPVIHFLLDRHTIRYYLLKHYRRESANNVLEKILLRAQYLVRNNELNALGRTDLLVQTWLFGNHTEAEFMEMDDHLLFNQIRKWSKYTNDPILHDLTLRFTAHNFFISYSCEKENKPIKPTKEITEQTKNKVNNLLNMDITMYPKELITDYYFTYDETTSKPYHIDRNEIIIYTSDKKVKKLSKYIKETKNDLGQILLDCEFERYLFIVPQEVEL